MNMESLVVFDFIGKQEFEKYIADRLAGDFKFHLANEIIKTEKHIANLESKAEHHDSLVDSLESLLRMTENETLNDIDEQLRYNAFKALRKAKGES